MSPQRCTRWSGLPLHDSPWCAPGQLQTPHPEPLCSLSAARASEPASGGIKAVAQPPGVHTLSSLSTLLPTNVLAMAGLSPLLSHTPAPCSPVGVHQRSRTRSSTCVTAQRLARALHKRRGTDDRLQRPLHSSAMARSEAC